MLAVFLNDYFECLQSIIIHIQIKMPWFNEKSKWNTSNESLLSILIIQFYKVYSKKYGVWLIIWAKKVVIMWK